MTLLGKIRIIFVVAALGAGVLFGLAYRFQIDQFRSQLMDRFMQVAPFCHAQITHKQPIVSDKDPLLSTGGFVSLHSNDPVLLQFVQTQPIKIHMMPRGKAEIYQSNNGQYYTRLQTKSPFIPLRS